LYEGWLKKASLIMNVICAMWSNKLIVSVAQEKSWDEKYTQIHNRFRKERDREMG
jgi:hypothetical protein